MLTATNHSNYNHYLSNQLCKEVNVNIKSKNINISESFISNTCHTIIIRKALLLPNTVSPTIINQSNTKR